jgi:hypothetical protein
MQGVAAKNDASSDLSRARASVTGRCLALASSGGGAGVVAGWAFWRPARWGKSTSARARTSELHVLPSNEIVEADELAGRYEAAGSNSYRRAVAKVPDGLAAELSAVVILERSG